MKYTKPEETERPTMFLVIIVTIIIAAALFVPMPPDEVPVLDEIYVPHIIEKAEASYEPMEVRIATTSNHVVVTTDMVVDKGGDSKYEELADAIIHCESTGRNIEIIDTNGKWSRGIAQFQDATWDWMSRGAGIQGVATETEKARKVLIWGLENGHGRHWTCLRIVQEKFGFIYPLN